MKVKEQSAGKFSYSSRIDPRELQFTEEAGSPLFSVFTSQEGSEVTELNY